MFQDKVLNTFKTVNIAQRNFITFPNNHLLYKQSLIVRIKF
jgi:hypothetical protein